MNEKELWINDKYIDKCLGFHKYYYKQIIKQLKFLIPRNSSILDVGCGNGAILASLKSKRVVGIDCDSRIIKIAKQRFPDIEFIETSVELFSSNEQFDNIILVNSIGCFKDIQTALDNLRKNCHINTRIIIFHYNFLWYPILKTAEIFKLKKEDTIQNWVSPNDIINLLEISGYETIQHSGKIIFPIYFPIISNFLNKYIANMPLINKFDLMNSYIARLPMQIQENERTCSIIIPARNEAGNIEAVLERTPNLGIDTELIFVEGHSTDNTWEEIIRVSEKYRNKRKIYYAKQPGKGKGNAVRYGFSLAKNNILFILDADLSVDPEEMKKFYELLESGRGEFINGSRLIYPIEKEAMRPINLFGNKIFSLIFTFLLSQRFKDTLCGTKVLTKKNYERIANGRKYFGDFDPFGDFDLIFGASKLGLKILELPVHYKQRTYGTTNIQRWKHGLILLRMCIFAMRRIKFV